MRERNGARCRDVVLAVLEIHKLFMERGENPVAVNDTTFAGPEDERFEQVSMWDPKYKRTICKLYSSRYGRLCTISIDQNYTADYAVYHEIEGRVYPAIVYTARTSLQYYIKAGYDADYGLQQPITEESYFQYSLVHDLPEPLENMLADMEVCENMLFGHLACLDVPHELNPLSDAEFDVLMIALERGRIAACPKTTKYFV